MNYNLLPEHLKRGIATIQAYGFLNSGERLTVKAVPGDAIWIEKSENELSITYDTEPHFYMALVRGLVMENGKYPVESKVKQLGLLLDCSRNAVPKPEMVKKLILLLVMM